MPRLRVLNQYYRPGVEATMNLLSELCEALAEDMDVTVLTGQVAGRDDLPSEDVVVGARVVPRARRLSPRHSCTVTRSTASRSSAPKPGGSAVRNEHVRLEAWVEMTEEQGHAAGGAARLPSADARRGRGWSRVVVDYFDLINATDCLALGGSS